MRGRGDEPRSPAYHADLTTDYGIRYVWRGRTTSITGQNAALTLRSLATILGAAHPVGSARTAAKQALKIWLGWRAHRSWELHATNRVCRPAKLRDGRPIWEFLRSNPHWDGPGMGATADGIGAVVTSRFLDHLVRREAACVLYTHLGKVRDRFCPFGERTQTAFRRLANMRERGVIQVTTTARLLRYITVRDSVRFRASRFGERVHVEIQSVDDPVRGAYKPSADDVMGLTFAISECRDIKVTLGNGPALDCHVVRAGSRAIASVRWRPLAFPDAV